MAPEGQPGCDPPTPPQDLAGGHSTEEAPGTKRSGGALQSKSESDEPVKFSDEELDELLENPHRWTIFEDAEDEVHYLRRRCDVLAQGLLNARAEISHLHEAGLRLQDAYENLQKEFREVAGDTVYWQALAQARAEEIKSLEAAAAARALSEEAAAVAAAAAAAEQASQAYVSSGAADASPDSAGGARPEAEPQEHCDEAERPEPQGRSCEGSLGSRASEPEVLRLSAREALRGAAAEAAFVAEAARWRRLAEQRGEEVAQLRRCSTASGETPLTGPSQFAGSLRVYSGSVREIAGTGSSQALVSALAGTALGWQQRQKSSTPLSARSLAQAAGGSASTPTSASVSVAGSDYAESSEGASSRMERTPPRRPSSDAGSSSPSESWKSCASVASTVASSREPASKIRSTPSSPKSQSSPAGITGARKWGIGSSPKRCPGLGTPSRRAQTATSSDAGSARQNPSPMRASTSAGVPSTSTVSTASTAASPANGQKRIAALVDLFEGKQRSPPEKGSGGACQSALHAASPMRPTARRLNVSTSPAGAPETKLTIDKRAVELARLIGICPEDLERAWTRPGGAPSSRTMDVWLRCAQR